jgi:hypothetical protein
MASSRCRNVVQRAGCEADSLAHQTKNVAGASLSCLDTGTAAIYLTGLAEEVCLEDQPDIMKQTSSE